MSDSTNLNGKTALVTGGSKGLGRGIVEALAAQGVHVWALARNAEPLERLKREVKGVDTICADMTDPLVAAQALEETQPDILVLNAGATPAMGPSHEMTWEQFSRAWDTDVKATFHFSREALAMPLKPGSTVVIVSSGAAVGGSPRSGGYAGAKRTQWFMAQYFQNEAAALKLGIRFVALIPQAIVNATDLGHAAIVHYAAYEGITEQAYLERFGVPLTPAGVGDAVVKLVTDSAYKDGVPFVVRGSGVAALS